jgi:hypothetical protein
VPFVGLSKQLRFCCSRGGEVISKALLLVNFPNLGLFYKIQSITIQYKQVSDCCLMLRK